MDIEEQFDCGRAMKSLEVYFWIANIYILYTVPIRYLSQINISKFKKSLVLTHINITPMHVYQGRFWKENFPAQDCKTGHSEAMKGAFLDVHLCKVPLWKDNRQENLTHPQITFWKDNWQENPLICGLILTGNYPPPITVWFCLRCERSRKIGSGQGEENSKSDLRVGGRLSCQSSFQNVMCGWGRDEGSWFQHAKGPSASL